MLRYNEFNLLVGVKSIDRQNPEAPTATVDPADLILHWSGKVCTDGQHCCVFTPIGMVTSRSLPGWQLSPLHMGHGVEFRPTGIAARPTDSTSLLFIDPTDTGLESGNTAALKPICRELIERTDLQLHLTIRGQPCSVDFVGLPGHHGRNLLQNTAMPGVPLAFEQLVEVFPEGDPDTISRPRPFLLLGSCSPGTMFNPTTDVRFPDTIRAIYDREALRRCFEPAAPPRLETGERPPKALKLEVEIKREVKLEKE